MRLTFWCVERTCCAGWYGNYFHTNQQKTSGKADVSKTDTAQNASPKKYIGRPPHNML